MSSGWEAVTDEDMAAAVVEAMAATDECHEALTEANARNLGTQRFLQHVRSTLVSFERHLATPALQHACRKLINECTDAIGGE